MKLVKMARETKCDAIVVLETHSDLARWENFVNKMFPGWKQVNNFDLYDNGRIGILWDPKKLVVTTIERHPQVVSLQASSLVYGLSFVISAVYGFYSVSHRLELWNSLQSVASLWGGPWVIAGDFNCVMAENERIGRAVTTRETRDFKSICETLDLSQAPTSGCFYTFIRDNVRSKIDRVMINKHWQNTDVHPSVSFLPPGHLSDHCIGVIKLGQYTRTRGRFHFSNMWVNHPLFLSTIRDNWRYVGRGYKQFVLCKKLSSTREGLRRLNRDQFSRLRKQKRHLNKLKLKQCHPPLMTIYCQLSLD